MRIKHNIIKSKIILTISISNFIFCVCQKVPFPHIALHLFLLKHHCRLGQTRQVTVYRLICKGTIEERILQRAREKSEIHRMVIQGGSFKGKGGDLKPKEVVSLLLDDEEIERRVKVKMEEEQDQDDSKPVPDNIEPNKATKREAANELMENGVIKKFKVEDFDTFEDDEPQPLFDFAGDKIGPKKVKGKGGKRGRPKGSIKAPKVNLKTKRRLQEIKTESFERS